MFELIWVKSETIFNKAEKFEQKMKQMASLVSLHCVTFHSLTFSDKSRF